MAFGIRVLCFFCRHIILYFNAAIIVVYFNPEIIGILLTFGFVARLRIKEAKNIFTYYYSIGDEKEMIFTDKVCIEKLDDDIDETPWDKLKGMKIDEKSFAIFMDSRPVLLLSREKLAINDISILEAVYSKYQDVWAINNKKKQQPITKEKTCVGANKQEIIVTNHLENTVGNEVEQEIKRKDGFYVEMTKARYLRQYAIRTAFSEKKGKLLRTIGLCQYGLVYFVGFLFRPILFSIIFIAFLGLKVLVRRIKLSAYDKKKLSYTVYLDFSRGLVVKGFYKEVVIKWEQVKKILEGAVALADFIS